MTSILLFVAFLLGGLWMHRPVPIQDVAFLPFVHVVELEAVKRGKTLPGIATMGFEFADLTYPIVGQCHTLFGHYKIKFDKSYWDKASMEDKELLVAHELGHCSLARGHRDTFNSVSGRYDSIMNSTVFSGWVFRDNRTKYYDELFEEQH